MEIAQLHGLTPQGRQWFPAGRRVATAVRLASVFSDPRDTAGQIYMRIAMDEFETFTKGLTSPATKHFAIIPDDNADLPVLPRVIYCQTEGTVIVRDADGISLPYTMTVGDRLDFRGVRVMNTGTTGVYYGWS
jgi:hypothetical protein